MAAATVSKCLCVICNKAAGVFKCEGCQRSFCRKHSTEHSLELSKEMDNVIYHQDLLRQELTGQNNNTSKHPLMMNINDWERESIEKILATADKARQRLLEAFSSSKEAVTKNLEEISVQLRSSKEADDYSEKDLNHWLQAFEKLKNQLVTPPNVNLNKLKDETWIQPLTVSTTPLQSNEKFDRVLGDVRSVENGLVAQHNDSTSLAEVRGLQTYSSGIHRISLKIEKMFNNQWMFWGVISQGTVMQNNSYSSPSAYGWAMHGFTVLNGQFYSNQHDGDFIENDTIHLTLNCDNRLIHLENDRTKKQYSIPIDLMKCPFPWQLHACLIGRNDRLRILQ